MTRDQEIRGYCDTLRDQAPIILRCTHCQYEYHGPFGAGRDLMRAHRLEQHGISIDLPRARPKLSPLSRPIEENAARARAAGSAVDYSGGTAA